MIDPATVERHRLANGLTILIRRDSAAPVACVVTHVKAGYFDETDDVVGISHVLEHMYFKGTPTRGVGEIARATKALGGYLNAHTIYDHTLYFAVLPKDGFGRGLEIQADAFANALIDTGELQKELEVIVQEAKRKEDSPAAVAIERLYETLFDHHRMRRWRIGREPALRAFTREHVAAFYRGFYHPGNAILVIVGDVDVDETLQRVEALYGTLPSGDVVRSARPAEQSPPGFRYCELAGDIGQSQVAFGWRTPGTLHPDTVPLDVFASALASGRGSRLYRAVRERQLASSVDAENYTPTELGVFLMRSEGPPERAGEAAAVMWNELEAARDHGVSGTEVERVQRLMEGHWLRRLETMEGQATMLAEWEALGDWTLGERYYSQVMGTRADDATDAARRHLDSGQASMLVYRPAAAASFAGRPEEARARLQADSYRSVSGSSLPAAPAPPGRRSVSAELERIDGTVFVFRTRRGVPILVRQRKGAAMVHLGVYAAVGAAAEPPDRAGLATITSRAMVKGTGSRTPEQVANESELLGGTITSGVTSDSMGWTFSVPRPRLEDAVTLLADVVQHSKLSDAAVDTERAIALAQLAELRDDMYRYPIRLANAAAYGTHPYGRGLLGSEASLREIAGEDARRWHAERVLQSPVTLAVVGDVQDDEVASLLGSVFDEIEETPVTFVAAPAWPAKAASVTESRERAQTALALAFPGPARRDRDRFAAALIAGVTSGLGGRFFDRLRDERSLAYTVHAHAIERVSAGMFLSYIATSPSQEEEARAGLLAEFARLREERVTEDELGRAKVYASGSHAVAQQSGGNVLGEMIDTWLFGAGLHELDEFETNVRAVTSEQMRALAERCFDPERRAEGIVRGTGNRKQVTGNR